MVEKNTTETPVRAYCVTATLSVHARSAAEARERIAAALLLTRGFVEHAWCDRDAKPCVAIVDTSADRIAGTVGGLLDDPK